MPPIFFLGVLCVAALGVTAQPDSATLQVLSGELRPRWIAAVSGPDAPATGDVLTSTTYEGIGGFNEIKLTLKTYLTHYGPGLYLVVIFSTLVLLSTVISVFKGAKLDAKRKSEEREARMASRRPRRS